MHLFSDVSENEHSEHGYHGADQFHNVQTILNTNWQFAREVAVVDKVNEYDKGNASLQQCSLVQEHG